MDIRMEKSEKINYRNISFKELVASKFFNEAQRIVFKYDSMPYSWSDIETFSQIVAFDLNKIGVKKGSHVALCGMNSANWVFTFFAIQKLGAIAVLTNFNLSVSEINGIISSGDVTHFCFGQMSEINDYDEFVKILPCCSYDIRDCVDFSDRISEYKGINRLFGEKVYDDDVSVMIFTSGSTGKPKGVLLSAYNIINSSLFIIESTRLSSDDRVCLMLPLFHIFGIVTVLIPDCISGALMIIPKSIKTDDLMKTIEDEQCTVFHAVPTMFLALVNNKSFSTNRFSSLRSSILAGAAISTTQMKMLMGKFPTNHFAVSYGMSEIAPISITEYGDTSEHLTETIGKPVGNIRVRIFDNDCECKVGQIGEIQVKGDNLMTCYYKVDVNSQSIDGEGWLHTGDLGFFDKEGYLHFAGRKKSLIIRGGENINPFEVEKILCTEECIADAKVFGIPDDFWGERVAAAIILKEEYSYDETALKSSLKTKIARYKIPTDIVVFDAYPSLANGKADFETLKKEISERLNKNRYSQRNK